MQALFAKPFSRLLLGAVLLLVPSGKVLGQASPYRGLWVGDVTLGYVNEVTTPLDSNNVPVAPDPNVTTPTSDAAQLRLLLHVNGAGQVSLLKDVAVLNRTGGTNGSVVQSESDLALVTDEALYGDFPPQPAVRYATATFDFGDSRATEAVDTVMEAVAAAAASSVFTNTTDLGTDAGKISVQDAASQAAQQAAASIPQAANVADAYTEFLRTNLTQAVIDEIAGASDPASAAQSYLPDATNLQARSFYGDTRAVELIDAVVAAVQQAAAGTDKTNVAQNTAAAYADTANDYQRFIAGKDFGDMITAAATAASLAATNPAASSSSISTAVMSDPTVVAAKDEANLLKQTLYRDTRPTDAVTLVLDAIVTSAASALPAAPGSESGIQTAAEAAGRDALASSVARYPVSASTPTPDYSDFVQSADFQGSVAIAAEAAAEGAVSERVNNALYTAESVENAAKVAVVKALQNVYSEAARAERNELPLVGSFGPAIGDPRLTWDIKENGEGPLSAASNALTGTIYLPANHPTNPFRHRRHPDHTSGYDITRNLRFDFDGTPTNSLAQAGFGVDRISGTYREEIFGLHKPLGPNPDTEPIGLKVEGRFELNRVSHIDTLNAR